MKEKVRTIRWLTDLGMEYRLLKISPTSPDRCGRTWTVTQKESKNCEICADPLLERKEANSNRYANQ
jgi:hypothetical protein